jgi:Secretion system C-terminal sorting domain
MKKQLLFTLCSLLMLNGLLAQTTWTGATNTDWHTNSNWSNGAPNGTQKPITIPSSMPRYPIVSTSAATNTGTGGGSLVIQNGASITVTPAGADRTMDASNGSTFTINSGGSLILNGTASFYGFLTLYGPVTNSGNITINNNGDLYFSGGTLTCSGGTMTINSGGIMDGTGTYTGCLYTNPSGAFIGFAGNPDCITFGSGLTNNGTIRLDLGNGACSGNNSDKITVTGTATLGSGTFSISGGTAGTTYTVLTATSIATFTNQDISLGSGKYAHMRKVGNEIRAIVNNNAVLGIELLSFGVNTEGGKNLLTWVTGGEKDNSHFDIERSTDGTTFHSIGQVKGNNKPSSYQFVDNQPFATSYYRLKQVDFDGTETFSKIVSVQLKGKGKGLTIYPTLVSNGILTVDTEGGQLRDFSVSNLLGQQVLVGKTTQQIDVSALAKGTYILKVGTDVAKFVKQ